MCGLFQTLESAIVTPSGSNAWSLIPSNGCNGPEISSIVTEEMSKPNESLKGAPVLKPQSPEDWAFVNLSEPNQSKDKDLRQFVRSNAMRDYRQRKKRSESKSQSRPGNATASHSAPLPLPSSGPSLSNPMPSLGDGGRVKYCGHAECIHNCRYSPHGFQPGPQPSHGGSRIDPFNTLPFDGDRRDTDFVLNHCKLPWHLTASIHYGVGH